MDMRLAQDDLIFADADDIGTTPAKNTWQVMIVDDDHAIHDVTKLALSGFRFRGKSLAFTHCYTGAEAKQAIQENPETALMLLDVVMESDHAGLDVVKYVRDVLGNRNVRIVLRTGQPGQAPEQKVIAEYDINDYKEKTELTSHKLSTLLFSSLRSYQDIKTIEASKRGLSTVIEASANISNLTSMNNFASGVLEQLTALLQLEQGALYMSTSGIAAMRDGSSYKIVAGTGEFGELIGADAAEVLDKDVLDKLSEARVKRAHSYGGDSFYGFFETKSGAENLIYMSGLSENGVLEQELIELFSRNVSIAFENVQLHEELEATQREIVYMLGEAVETRSKETGNHVKRVAEISKLLALAYGLDAEEAEILKFASPLHDVGKVGIPDAILNKPGRHTDDEREVMQTHAAIGRDMLKGSKRRVLQAGSIIAGEHHERWDGAGYPHGKSGEDIHIFGRVTAVADVFDALGSDRCYKKAWPLDDIIAHFEKERGGQFDPTLVDLLFENMTEVQAILNLYPDHVEH